MNKISEPAKVAALEQVMVLQDLGWSAVAWCESWRGRSQRRLPAIILPDIVEVICSDGSKMSVFVVMHLTRRGNRCLLGSPRIVLCHRMWEKCLQTSWKHNEAEIIGSIQWLSGSHIQLYATRNYTWDTPQEIWSKPWVNQLLVGIRGSSLDPETGKNTCKWVWQEEETSDRRSWGGLCGGEMYWSQEEEQEEEDTILPSKECQGGNPGGGGWAWGTANGTSMLIKMWGEYQSGWWFGTFGLFSIYWE